MSTLTEVEAAADNLPPEQKKELICFLAARLRPAEQVPPRARPVKGPNGTLLLEPPPDTSPMTTQAVKQMLEDFA